MAGQNVADYLLERLRLGVHQDRYQDRGQEFLPRTQNEN